MEPTNYESITETQSCKGGVMSRFLALSGKRKIYFGNTDVGIASQRVKAILSNKEASKILIDTIRKQRQQWKSELSNTDTETDGK